jgi:hypothetical protein
MAENKNKLFREKNLEQIESPESLNDYLQVTSPGIWIILATIVVFLAGACIWGTFGHIDSSVKAAVIADGEETVCLVPEKALESAVKDRAVKIDKVEYGLAPETLEPMIISEDTNIYWILAGNLKIGDIVYQVPVSEKLDEGVYSGTIVTERLSPMSLLLN